ncbi:MAG TPA: hypothetical protein VFQ36_17135 [Ktedonobacteraceae bacterium]|nr:hypothetical protein [Ktedonobacteraceae bacterium]
MPALVQYYATVYWGIIITANVVIILFITTWIHINTMTKRQARLEALLRKLDKRLDETIDEIADIPAVPAQPQGYMPVYPVQSPLPQQQQFQQPSQPPLYPQ